MGAESQYVSNPTIGKAFLEVTYPKLKKHYAWFRRTQARHPKHYQFNDSELNEGYRWRGRTPQHILTSGLDDYPRSQRPNSEELHVDALCWVGLMATTLKNISTFLSEENDRRVFLQHETDVIRSIDSIHWSDPDQAYCDTTLNEDEKRRQKVCHKGYISLFLFLNGLIRPDHPHLGAVLDLLRNPKELWSPFGIRSLSKKDRYYGQGENYWRGPIWININYMVVQKLLVCITPSKFPYR